MRKFDTNTFRIVIRSGKLVVGAVAFCIVVANALKAAVCRFPAITAVESPDSVTVKFREYCGGVYLGRFYWIRDYVVVFRPSAPNVIHELKHAHNRTLFPVPTNTHAEEISAQCAEQLYRLECAQKHFNISADVNVSDTVIERDVNYVIPDLTRPQVDSCLVAAIRSWHNLKYLYRTERALSAAHSMFWPMTGPELEKMFTFKINGRHRSLYRECSPYMRRRLCDECNSENMMYSMRRLFHRAR